MSRDPYYSGGGRGRGDRWDSERFEQERDRIRYEERDSRFPSRNGPPMRERERSVDELYERRGPGPGPGPRGGFEDIDRYEKRVYYDDEPRYRRDVTIEKEREREYYSPSPPRRQPARPGFLRRQSSLDTFDRRPLARYSEREEYGPPARYDPRPPPLTPIPLPRTRGLPPPRRYAERDYEEIRVAEPDFYGDDEYRGFPERVREREIIRRRRRSRSRESRVSHSVRSSSSSSRSSVGESVRSEFPKKGKTRMPARLVSLKAIRDLGYPYEEEGDIIIIQKALGRENIDEVIKLSEDYKSNEKPEVETTLTTYVVQPEDSHTAPSTSGGTVIEETHTHEVFSAPAPAPPPPQNFHHPPPPPQNVEIVKDTTIIERRSPSPHHHHHHNHHHPNPIIVDASAPLTVGPLALARPRSPPRDERSIRAEIRALEAEKEALKRARRHRSRSRRPHRVSETDLVLYEHETFERPGEEVVLVKRERFAEPDGGVRIEKDRKGPPPKLIRAMLKTLT